MLVSITYQGGGEKQLRHISPFQVPETDRQITMDISL